MIPMTATLWCHKFCSNPAISLSFCLQLVALKIFRINQYGPTTFLAFSQDGPFSSKEKPIYVPVILAIMKSDIRLIKERMFGCFNALAIEGFRVDFAIARLPLYIQL